MPNTRIIFIGPMGVGKTSVAKRIAEILKLPYIDIDELRWGYFEQQPDYDHQAVEELFETSQEIKAFAYFKPFEARLVVDFLKEYPGGVLDFGAGYSVYEDQALFEKVRTAFSQCKHVILLRYSDDAQETLEALHKRHEEIPDHLYYALNQAFIESPCNERLATCVIDTKGQTIEAVVNAVLANITPL